MIDKSILDRDYPINEDGIVMALPEFLSHRIEPKHDVKNFWDVHHEVLEKYDKELMHKDSSTLARFQKEFYDKMALGYQYMDDHDKETGGIFWWKIKRIAEYDSIFLRRYKLLFVGAGNCRFARIFAKMGFQVVATDISVNMLKVGKERNEQEGIKNMMYVAHNAEESFPFKSNIFHSCYSINVIDHILDWNNYLSEKLRTLRHRGVLLERMPNALRWDFWKLQGELNEGAEIRTADCRPYFIQVILEGVKSSYIKKIWTHDRQINIAPLYYKFNLKPLLALSRGLYRVRNWWEDRIVQPHNHNKDDHKGMYTVFRVVKN